MSMPVQELIHKFEVGSGSRVPKLILGVIVVLAVAVVYDLNSFRTLTTPEGIDTAQLARNIADGKGYSTDFIRPLSLYLLKKKDQQSRIEVPPPPLFKTNTAELKTAPATFQPPERHPDLANAPLFPTLLAGVLKVMPFGFPNLLTAKSFSMYLPDLWITAFNQLLLLIGAALVFRLARRLFDEPVAWASAAVFVGTDLFWRFTASGLSTMLLMVFFLGITDLLMQLDRAVRVAENPPTQRKLMLLALGAGLLVGLGSLARYSFGFLIVPLVLWMAFLPSPRRGVLTVVSVVAFAAVLGPWVARNYQVSGTPFGTASYAAIQMTEQFPEDHLERSLQPDVSQIPLSDYGAKFWANTREMIQNDLPKFGGSWVSALFLVGLLVPFRNPTLNRMKIFLVLCLGMFFVVQALGKTGLPAESPELSSENLLVILAPLVFIFGVSLLFILLESSVPEMRSLVLAVFFCLACSPLVLNYFAPSALLYFPPWIQEKAAAVPENGTVMTDIPWAVAWYGHREAVWLPLKHREAKKKRVKEDFYALQQQFKPISALYLTSKTLKNMELREVAEWLQEEGEDVDWDEFTALWMGLAKRNETEKNKEGVESLKRIGQLVGRHWIKGNDESWASFLLGIYINREVPTGFPLRRAPLGLAPEIFLIDSERNSEKPIQSSK